MQLELVTLRGKKLDQKVYEVTIPTDLGPISIFPSHEDLVTLAVPGVLAVRHQKDDSDDKLEYLAVSGGIVKISRTKVQILVDEADQSEEISEAESKAALERAKELRKNAKTQVELDQAMELMDRHAVRLQVAGLRRRKRV